MAPAIDDALPPLRRRAPGVLLHRLSGSLDSLIARGIAREEGPDLYELVLDPEEGSEGGMVSIRMYVPVAGADELYTAWLAVPPEVPDGAVLRPSASLRGMRPIAFRVRRAR